MNLKLLEDNSFKFEFRNYQEYIYYYECVLNKPNTKLKYRKGMPDMLNQELYTKALQKDIYKLNSVSKYEFQRIFDKIDTTYDIVYPRIFDANKKYDIDYLLTQARYLANSIYCYKKTDVESSIYKLRKKTL